MLWIFDEASNTRSLFLDAVLSLGRQWFLRAGAWKLLIALAAAALQVTAGGLLWIALTDRIHWHGAAPSHDTIALQSLMIFIVISAGAIVLLVCTTTIWLRSFLHQRLRHARIR